MDSLNQEVQNIYTEQQRILDENTLVEDKKITSDRGRLIRKIKSTIKKFNKQGELSEEDKGTVEKLEDTLRTELERHEAQLKSRYQKEFMKGTGKISGLVTTLPKGISIQFKRIVNSINELKSAKTMKEKFKDVFKVAKDTVAFGATPVIFAGKFVIDHWYLLGLLLGLIPKVSELLKDIIGKIIPFFKKDKNKDKEKGKDKDKEDGKENEYTETVGEPAVEISPVLVTTPDAVPVTVPEKEPEEEAALSPSLKPVFALDSSTELDPRFETTADKVFPKLAFNSASEQPVVLQDTVQKLALDNQVDPRFETTADKVFPKIVDNTVVSTPPVVAKEPVEFDVKVGNPDINKAPLPGSISPDALGKAALGAVALGGAGYALGSAVGGFGGIGGPALSRDWLTAPLTNVK